MIYTTDLLPYRSTWIRKKTPKQTIKRLAQTLKYFMIYSHVIEIHKFTGICFEIN